MIARKIFLLLMISMFAETGLFAQQTQTAAESRAEQIHTLLDYRFRGGFYSFESLLDNTIKYPEAARAKCEIGTMIAAFKVDCQGNISNIRIKNPLGYGLKEALTKFLQATAGHWNECKNYRFTHFIIPIQFTMEGTKTDSINPVISYLGKNPGYACPDDSYYLTKAKEALAKGKNNRARTFLELLIKRNPFEQSYYEMLTKTVDKSKKSKKKRKKSK